MKVACSKGIEKLHALDRPTVQSAILLHRTHGTGQASTVPPDGTISPLFTVLSVPPHGHHLEKLSIVSFEH